MTIPPDVLWKSNHVPINEVIAQQLELTWKVTHGVFRFLCPECKEFNTATNPKTNLARCFRCRKNFNSIDIVMATRPCGFLQAVDFLRPRIQ